MLSVSKQLVSPISRNNYVAVAGSSNKLENTLLYVIEEFLLSNVLADPPYPALELTMVIRGLLKGPDDGSEPFAAAGVQFHVVGLRPLGCYDRGSNEPT